MNKNAEFEAEVAANIAGLMKDGDVQALSRIWLREITRHKYAYNFKWMGRPVIQFPQDMMAMQEIIWDVKPDLIIETGIAHGGSISAEHGIGVLKKDELLRTKPVADIKAMKAIKRALDPNNIMNPRCLFD